MRQAFQGDHRVIAEPGEHLAHDVHQARIVIGPVQVRRAAAEIDAGDDVVGEDIAVKVALALEIVEIGLKLPHSREDLDGKQAVAAPFRVRLRAEGCRDIKVDPRRLLRPLVPALVQELLHRHVPFVPEAHRGKAVEDLVHLPLVHVFIQIGMRLLYAGPVGPWDGDVHLFPLPAVAAAS